MRQIENYTIKQICKIMGTKLPAKFSYVAEDTLTSIASGINGISRGGGFILSGKNAAERAEKLSQALAKKPKFIFAGSACKNLPQLQEIPHAIVKDVYDIKVALARHIREHAGITVIGVTGSIGKTSTKEIIHSVLSQQFPTGKSQANDNNIRGIFSTVQKIDTDSKFHVQEFCVSFGARTMESKVSACMPNAAVVTNIGDAHIEFLGSRENILKEKIKLASEMAPGSPAFLNYDDELLKNVQLKHHNIISYAVYNKDADYYAEDIEVLDNSMNFTLVHKGRRTPVTMNVVGIHNIGNAAVAMAVGEWAGVPLEKIVAGIASFKTTGIRQTLANVGGYNLYIDCFNASPVSMIGAVHTLETMPVAAGGKRIAVVGEMLELGDQAPALHTNVGEEIGRSNVDLVLCFGGENAARIADAVRKAEKAVLYTSKRSVLNFWMRQLITRKDLTLFKGSHATLLHKSIDQVFGTSFHLSDHHYTGSTGKRFKYKIAADSYSEAKLVSISSYIGSSADVKVPTNRNGNKSFCIGAGCFKDNAVIQTVNIPSPIVNISDSAFQNCTTLTQINLPSTLKLIEANAFSGCSALESIVIPEGVIEIAENAFKNCSALTRVVLPSTIGRIGEGAFDGCENAKFEYPAGSYAETFISQIH